MFSIVSNTSQQVQGAPLFGFRSTGMVIDTLRYSPDVTICCDRYKETISYVHDITEVCDKLRELQQYIEVVELALLRAKALDPLHQGGDVMECLQVQCLGQGARSRGSCTLSIDGSVLTDSTQK